MSSEELSDQDIRKALDQADIRDLRHATMILRIRNFDLLAEGLETVIHTIETQRHA